MVYSALLSGIAGLLIGLFGFGLAAAKILEASHGAREGAAAMAGFFYFGPIGGIAGALLGVGLALRFGGRSAPWAKGLLTASATITALGGILFAMVAAPDSQPSYSHVIQFELEVPETVLAGIEIPGPNAMWGAAGDKMDDKPISQFFEKDANAMCACCLGPSLQSVLWITSGSPSISARRSIESLWICPRP